MSVGFSDVFPREVVMWKDKELVVTLPSLSTQAAFQTFLENETLAGIERGRRVVSPETYRMQLAEHNRCYTAKTFAWGMVDTQIALRNQNNFKKFLTLMLRQASIDGVRPEAATWLDDSLIDQIWDDLSYIAVLEDGTESIENKLVDAWLRVNRPLPKAPAPEAAPANGSTPTK